MPLRMLPRFSFNINLTSRVNAPQVWIMLSTSLTHGPKNTDTYLCKPLFLDDNSMYHSRLTIHPSVDENSIFSFRQGAEDERDTSTERNSEVGDRMITRYHSRRIIHLVSFPRYHPSVRGWKRHVFFPSGPDEEREREREETSDARVRSPIDARQSRGGGGRGRGRARRSSEWKNNKGEGGEGGLGVRPLFKMYVAYGWPKLLSISAGSSQDDIVHLSVLQDWLLLVSSSRVQIWSASQVSEFLTACGVCKIYHSLAFELVLGDLLRSCSFWSLWIRVSCVFFGSFFFGLLIGTHHGEGKGVWGVGNRMLRSDLDSTLATSWKKNGLVLLLQSVFCLGILSKSGSCLNLNFSSGTDIFSRLIYGFAMFVVQVIPCSAVVDLIVYARGSFLMEVDFRVLQWHR
jgi:hypothetical protein